MNLYNQLISSVCLLFFISMGFSLIDSQQNDTSATKPAALSYGLSSPFRAVNLGGWLLIEPWITPSYFTRAYSANVNNTPIIDEYTLTIAGGTEAVKLI